MFRRAGNPPGRARVVSTRYASAGKCHERRPLTLATFGEGILSGMGFFRKTGRLLFSNKRRRLSSEPLFARGAERTEPRLAAPIANREGMLCTEDGRATVDGRGPDVIAGHMWRGPGVRGEAL